MKVEITVINGEKSTIELNGNESDALIDALQSGSIALFSKADYARRAAYRAGKGDDVNRNAKRRESDEALDQAMFVAALGDHLHHGNGLHRRLV